MTRAELKSRAKESLKGKYLECWKLLGLYILICFVVGFLVGFLGGMLGLNETIISSVSEIVALLLGSYFGFGIVSFFLKISRNEEVTYKELFSKKELLVPYLIITILTGIFTFLWSLLFVIPGIIAAISYTLVYYIKLDNPELGVKEVIKKSKEMMNGHKMDYFVLTLSFIGWSILGMFTFGILYIWLMPYVTVTYCNFYNNLKK